MDILFSIPLVSYLLAPTLTSWSTSLNLLFFYMTWATLVLSHPPLHVHLVGIVAIRLVFWLLPALASFFFDVALPSLAEGIKHGGGRGGALPRRDLAAFGRLLGLVLSNLAILTAAEGALSWGFTEVVGTTEFTTSTTLPFPWQILKHIVILLTAREVLGYYIHRFILHGNTPFNKPHLQYAHHTRSAPFSLQLLADHPLPLLLHRLVPLYLPAVMLRPHLLTYFLFVALCTGEETLAMSGYTIVPGIIMSGIAQRSAIHYAGRGVSNYGAWGILDWAHGTSRGRDVFDDVRDEADKHSVKERSMDKADEGASMLQDGVDALRGGGRKKTDKKRSKKGE